MASCWWRHCTNKTTSLQLVEIFLHHRLRFPES